MLAHFRSAVALATITSDRDAAIASRVETPRNNGGVATYLYRVHGRHRVPGIGSPASGVRPKRWTSSRRRRASWHRLGCLGIRPLPPAENVETEGAGPCGFLPLPLRQENVDEYEANGWDRPWKVRAWPEFTGKFPVDVSAWWEPRVARRLWVAPHISQEAVPPCIPGAPARVVCGARRSYPTTSPMERASCTTSYSSIRQSRCSDEPLPQMHVKHLPPADLPVLMPPAFYRRDHHGHRCDRRNPRGSVSRGSG